MGSNDNIIIKVYFDTSGSQYIDKNTASFLGVNIDKEYYKLTDSELNKLVGSFNIEYELIKIISNENNSLSNIVIYFDDQNNYLDKETALRLGFKCDDDYLKIEDDVVINLYSEYDLEYREFENKTKEQKETIVLYIDEDNSVYIDKEFASLLGIKTDMNYVELGKGTIEVAKKYYNVIFKDLYTKEEISNELISSIQLHNK